MSDIQTDQERIHGALQSAPPNAAKDSLLTGWVVLAEWMDAAGQSWFTMQRSQQMTPWSQLGMLHYAIDAELESDEDD